MTLKGPAKDAKGLADYRSVLVAGNQVFVGTGKWNTEKKAREGEIRVWDAKSGKASKPLAGHTTKSNAALSKDGKFLASASQDNTVLIWNLGEGKTTQTIKGHSDYVTGVSFSPDGKQLVTTSKDKTVRVWDIGGAKELASFKVEREVETKDAKGKVTKTKELGREFTRAVFTNDGKNVIPATSTASSRSTTSRQERVERTERPRRRLGTSAEPRWLEVRNRRLGWHNQDLEHRRQGAATDQGSPGAERAAT